MKDFVIFMLFLWLFVLVIAKVFESYFDVYRFPFLMSPLRGADNREDDE